MATENPSKKQKIIKSAETAEPAEPKAEAVEPNEDDLQAIFEKLENVQEKLQKIEEESAKEILQVEKKYNKRRRPFYKSRAEIIKNIPGFWKKTLSNHELFANMLNDEDVAMLDYLEELDVEDNDELAAGFKISMTFKANPWFGDKVVSKQYTFDSDGEVSVKNSAVHWKEKGKELSSRGEEDVDSSFFAMWFVDPDANLEIAEQIKEYIWPDPGQYYHSLNDEDEDDEEGGEDPEVEEEK